MKYEWIKASKYFFRILLTFHGALREIIIFKVEQNGSLKYNFVLSGNLNMNKYIIFLLQQVLQEHFIFELISSIKLILELNKDVINK